MEEYKIIKELSEILMLEEEFEIEKTYIKFDSLSSLMLVEFLDSNFNLSISNNEIQSFNTLKDVLNFIKENGGR